MMNPAMMSQMMGGAGMGAHPLAQNPELMAQMMQVLYKVVMCDLLTCVSKRYNYFVSLQR